MSQWEFWIDRGGTFTDVIGRAPDGRLQTAKLLSEDTAHYQDAALEGIRRLLGIAAGVALDATRIGAVKMGTTVATNALLERKGARTVLVITRGLADALRIATQARPKLFERRIVLPEMMYERVIEADERLAADGSVIRPLDGQGLQLQLERAVRDGFRACAIVFMHAYRWTLHEAAAAVIAQRCGFTQVSVSHQVSPLMKLIPRGDTTVVDAYLSPILKTYTERLRTALPGVPLFFMQSSGGLTHAEQFQGKDAILSGPAGGIVGMACSAHAAGFDRVIGFDMGGTSTDVSHFAGEYERAFDTEVGGVRVRAPMLNIHTIAAGGGSIIRFDGARLRVGPESAGADPGPASYRRGGPLTVTDANVLLGRIQPAYFPHVFGDGNQPLEIGAAQRGFADLADRMSTAAGHAIDAAAAAAGALRIAVGSMANAIKKISVLRGHDLEQYTLQSFGGAAGQHACLVADALGMPRVYVHSLAGVLSAYGMGLAEQHAMRERSVDQPLDAAGLDAARRISQELVADAAREFVDRGALRASVREQVQIHIRYAGSDSALACALSSGSDVASVRREFESVYRRRYAFFNADRPLLIEAVTAECAVRVAAPAVRNASAAPASKPAAAVVAPMYTLAPESGGQWTQAPLYRRESLQPGDVLDGPAVVADQHSTTVVEDGWRLQVGAAGMSMQRVMPRTAHAALTAGADPIMLELFNNIFMNIAEQMGLRLQNTAHSVNIKERLDFSCALFDASGALIANAPHMPVHLGSMSDSVRSVIDRNAAMRSGDVFMLNDPYHGGTHLPDITVVTPVYLDAHDAQPAFFVASRGHHADVGGTTPGSMPAFSRGIDEEGVLIDNALLVRDGTLRAAEVLALLQSGPYPARNPEQNLADLTAQVAANEKGAQELRALVKRFDRDTVTAYMRHVQDNAEFAVRRVIDRLSDGHFRLQLDNGAHIEVALRIDRQRRTAVIDFSGSSAQLANNFNAPRAITTAAVLYVFRTLVNDDIPLNAGCLRPLEIIVPAGCMLNPAPPAAVVAGNVETSMCITNALYGALGVMAASQCTMNNFTFGNARHQYYETIAGGSGAGDGFDGADAVQTHMTNSRLTDPEVLEARFPVRLESHEIRAHSGGRGRWHGGNGATRRIRFLEPMTASILSNGRRHGAFGMAGGEPGATGETFVARCGGGIEHLEHIGQVELEANDIMVIVTPGGGGFGTEEAE